MRTLLLLAVLVQAALGQLPVAGPVSLESAGSLLPQFFGPPFCGGVGDNLCGMNDSKIAFMTRCRMEPGDLNAWTDVYVRDFVLGATVLVSATPAGMAGNADSSEGRISGNGQGVVFSTLATDIVAGTGGFSSVVYRDLQSGASELVSIGINGAPANGDSIAEDISADGRFIVFRSSASNLVAGDTEGFQDIFLRDRAAGTTRRVSQLPSGVGGNWASARSRISGDGASILFLSAASNLAPIDPGGSNSDWMVYDVSSQLIEIVGIGNTGVQTASPMGLASISTDGRHVAFASGSPLEPGAGLHAQYVRDRLTGVTEVISVSSGGEQANDVCLTPEISGNGRFVAFVSRATNLVPNDTNFSWDAFVHDRAQGSTIRVNVGPDGAQDDGNYVGSVLIDSSGRRVSFLTNASTIVPKPTCFSCPDIIVADLGPQISIGGQSGSGPWRPYARVVEQFGMNPWVLSLIEAPALSPALLAVATNPGLPVPFGVGALVPWPPDFLLTLSTDAQGHYALPFTWPVSAPIGTQVWAQWGIVDPTAPMGVALSNAVSLTSP